METLIETQPTFMLNNGSFMPQLGLGVLKSKEGTEVENAVQYALNNDYRLIDTAAAYRNEKGVGNALRKSSLSREEIFLTTKVWNSDQGFDETLAAFERSLATLQTDYVDLYLVHWPVKDKYLETWKALEEIYRQGRAKAIGVSNFQVHHLQKLMEVATVLPAVNQVEMHPHLQQQELFAFAQQHRIRLQAWRPIMMGEVNNIAALSRIAQKYSKSPVQITLRWLLQKGVAVIPKSITPQRIDSNAQIFDFVLNEEEMTLISKLDQGRRLGPDPDNFNF